MAHWTQELKDENAILRAALKAAEDALRTIPQGRLDKEQRCPYGGEGSIAYRQCAEEVDRLNRDALASVNDILMAGGVPPLQFLGKEYEVFAERHGA